MGTKIEVDLANERVVLATMIKSPAIRRRLSTSVAASEFGDPRHAVVFRVLGSMVKGGLEYSEDTVEDLAGGDDYGGVAYLRALVEDYEVSPNVDHHVSRLRIDAAKLAVLADDIPAAVEAATDPKGDPVVLSRILRGAALRVERTSRSFDLRGKPLRDAYYDDLRLRAIVGDVVEGTGFARFDHGMTRGFVPGLSTIVGRPGHGKTTWLANVVRMRTARGKATYVCGWEMVRADYLDMLVAQETGIPGVDLGRRVAQFSEQERASIVAAVEKFTDRDLLAIEGNPFPSLPKAEKHWDVNARNLDYLEGVVVRESGRYPLFAIDVVGKLLADRRPDAISEALVRIREIAISAGVHIMLLHHMNRDSAESRPTLEGIKGSGAFEEESDIIIGIDRPILRASPARRRKMSDVLDAHMLKQRKGPAPFAVRYRFDGPRYLLTDETEIDFAMLDGGEEDEV